MTVEPPPAQPLPSLASVYSNILAGASTDPNFTGAGDALSSTPYRWSTYLNIALQGIGKTSPDLSTVFPGVDLTQPMAATTFWASMGPALTQAYGLSGFFAGLGAYMAGLRGLGQDETIQLPYGEPVVTGTGSMVANQDGSITLPGGGTIFSMYQSDASGNPAGTSTSSPASSSTTIWLAVAAAAAIGLIALAGK